MTATNNLCKVVLGKGSTSTYPYAAIAVFKCINQSKANSLVMATDLNKPFSVAIDGNSSALESIPVAKYLATAFASDSLYGGKNSVQASQIDYWVDYSIDVLSSKDFKPVLEGMKVLDNHLTMKSYMVGYNISLADLVVWGALKGCGGFQKLVRGNKDVGTHLKRWYDYVSSLDFVSDITPTAPEKPSKAGKVKDQGSFDIDLKGAEKGKVVTRFPPEPSGYLHIGHIKAALLNNYFARHYEGKLLLRFDDTNPSKEKEEYQEAIREDLKRMEIFPDSVSYTSDHFQHIYDKTIQLIKDGHAYVDDTDVDTMRAERMDGIESKRRNMSVEETLARFEEMKNGEERGLNSCLRVKIDMQNKNKALRDPVIYRCNLIPHHRTGSQWKIYPTYDLACPLVDSLEGVTHALRTNEYRDRNPQYEWFLKALNVRYVHIWDFSRVNFVYTLLSKRKLTWFVDEGLVAGWDDPRFPTVRGILRRGMTVEALRTYVLMQGASQKDLLMSWDKIWAINKKVIDPVSGRYVALAKEKLVKVKLTSDLKAYTEAKPLHKKNPDVGTKDTTYSSDIYMEYEDAKDLEVGEEITFMDWGNVIVKKIDRSQDSVSLVEVELHLEGDFKKTKKKLTWLSSTPPVDNASHNLVNIELLDYDYLISKPKLEEDDKLQDFITPKSEFKVEAIGDANLRKLKQGTIIQLERKGYYIVDSAFEDETKPMRLISIPDGKDTGSKAAASASLSPKAKKGEKKASPVCDMYSVSNVYGEINPVNYKDVCDMYKVNPAVDSSLSFTGAKGATAPAAGSSEAAPEKAGKKDKKEKKAKAPQPAAAPEGTPLSKLDMVIGKIVEIKKHPDAETLYVEQIDVGEEKPREVVSGLVKFIKMEDMLNKHVVVLRNLKPANMRGIKSYGMVLCASNADHTAVELLQPPKDSSVGDKVYFDGHDGEPEAVLNPKKKIFEKVQVDFMTGNDLVARWKDTPFRTSKGVVTTFSLKKATIK